MEHTLQTEVNIERRIDEVFEFFCDASNLNKLTPPWMSFEIMTPSPIHMRVGAMIQYKLRVRRVPLNWTSEITAWEPPYRFVDEQRVGPYRRWVHEHLFEDQGGVTIVRDRVRYAVPGWILEPMVHGLVVKPDLDRIFAYRVQRIRELLGSVSQAA